MTDTRPKRIILGFIILGVSAILLGFVFRDEISKSFVGIAYDTVIKPPERSFCLNTSDDYRCVTDRAIQEEDPSLCYYLDAGDSDRCVDEVIIAARDVAACDKVRNRATKEYCKKINALSMKIAANKITSAINAPTGEKELKFYTNNRLKFSLTYPSLYTDAKETNGSVSFEIKGSQDLSGFEVSVASTPYASTQEWIDAQPKGSASAPGYQPVLWLNGKPNGTALVAEYVVVDQDGNTPIYGKVMSAVLVQNGKLYRIAFANQTNANDAPNVDSSMMDTIGSLMAL